MLGSNAMLLGIATLIITPVVMWLLSHEQARCSICGIPQGRTVLSKYFRLIVWRNWACVNCRRNFGWWGRERVPVRVTPR
jgi:hypothetical protein